MKIKLSILFVVFAYVFSFGQGCTMSTSNLTELSGDDGSGNCTYSIDILFVEGSGPDNGTLTFSSSNVTILAGAGPHSCACSGNTYTVTFEATCMSTATFTASHDNSGNGNDCSVQVDGISLPVSWLGFDLKKETEDLLEISWSTGVEINNDFFVIEYSRNGYDFHKISTINGAGNSYKKTEYSYSHRHDFIGVVYFRIKQVDFQGKYSYSSIIEINLQNERLFTISPNPAQETIFLLKSDDEIIVQIFDINGSKILTTTNTQIDIRDLADGLYTVLIDNGVSIQSQQFIKAK